jgi:hypothetical protein
MPAKLCFDADPVATLYALEDLRVAIHRPSSGARLIPTSKRTRSRVPRLGRYLDFETIESITPAAALVLAAEYERRTINGGQKPFIVNVDAWNPSVFESLNRIGFFQAVGYPIPERAADFEAELVVVPMRSGNTTDTEAINQLISDLRQLYPNRGEDEKAPLLHLYGAMIEAVGNVVHHAYPKGAVYRFPPVGRWWMTGAVDRRARRMTAVVFDQGVTIPVSLPEWERYAGVRRRLLSVLGGALEHTVGTSFGIPRAGDPRSDGIAISAAVEESASSTGATGRGTGLAQMRQFVDQCRDGMLRIISRQGEVIFRPGGGCETRNYGAGVGGTLIEWNVLI